MAVSDIRFKHLGYVALNVSNLENSRHFYEDIVGLKRHQEPAHGKVFLSCSSKHHDLVLVESAEPPGLKRIGWEMEDGRAYAAVREHLTEIGLKIFDVAADEAQELGVTEAFRVTEPTTGTTMEFYPSMKRAPSDYEPTHTQIARLGHFVLNSVDRSATEKFLIEDLNFRVSDRIEETVTFMRCFPNPYHHSFGVGQATSNGLNHINFMVSCMADIGKGNNRMRKNGVDIVFGPGKHPPSESVFLYFLDPDNLTVEYSFGMEEFPEDAPREPREMVRGLESVDYWEGMPDPRFGKAGAIESLEKAG